MRRRRAATFLTALLIAGCASSTPSPAPSTPSEGLATATPIPVSSAGPSSEPTQALPTLSPVLTAGALAETVSDRLRVRSQPRVSDDSLKYEPVLPLGTRLTIVGGPVEASGYTWYEVEPIEFALNDGKRRGWVALGDHDGTPWIAAIGSPIDGLELAMSSVKQAPVDPKAAKATVASLNAFAVDAYRQLLRDPVLSLSDKNAVFSPTSIALALGMTRAGARGPTADEMDDVLHVEGWGQLGPGLNALGQELASRNDRWQDYDGATREVALRIANTTFAQRGWTLEPPFLDAIAEAFGAGVHLVDYGADSEAARRTINAWVDRETVGRIPELLTPPDVSSATKLFLVNAIYLKAEWDQWFDTDGTEPRTFTRLDGSKVNVPTMVAYRGALSPVAPYARGDGWRAVELRYRTQHGEADPQLAMTLIRPDDLPSFESSLSTGRLREIIAALDKERAGWGSVTCPSEFDNGCYPYDLSLYMPKFAIETRAGLKDLLAALGMRTAFDPVAADLSGIHVPDGPEDNPYISAVIHQANIDVDEKGTEAAAATAVGVDVGGGPSALDKITFRLDRPFLFLLRDVKSGAILFMGRVVDPSTGR